MWQKGVDKMIYKSYNELGSKKKTPKMQGKEKPHMLRTMSLKSMKCKLWMLSLQLKSAAICDATNDMEPSNCAGISRQE